MLSSAAAFRHRRTRVRRVLAALVGSSLLASGLTGVPARADGTQGPVVYVSSLWGNEVFAIDSGTGATLATIPINVPQALAINPAGTELWVAGQDGVSIVDTATDAVVAVVPVNDGGQQLSFNQAGTRAFVRTDSTADYVIDTASHGVLGIIGVDYGTDQVVSSPDGSVLYVSQDRTDGVAVVDGASFAQLATVSLNGTPGIGGDASLAVNPAGTRLYAAVPDQQTVYVLDTSTDTVAATIPIPGGAGNIVLDATGARAYVLGSDGIAVIDTATNTIAATLPAPAEASDLTALNAAGSVLYASGIAATDAYAIDTTTGAVLSTYPLASPASGIAATLAPQPTSTTLTTTPSGSATVGTLVTVTARITPSSAGTVQFYDGANPIGPPATTIGGSAKLVTSELALGSHTLTAAFTPSASTSLPSTSPPVTIRINPAGIAADQTTTVNGTGTVTAAPISTSGPRLLVAYVGADGPAGTQSATVSGAGLTWTLAARANKKGTGTAEIWTAVAPTSLTGATVTSTLKTGGFDQSLTVVAYSSASGVGASATASKTKNVPAVSLTTTRANSWVFGVGEDYTAAVPRTLGAGQNLISQWVDTATGETFWVQDESSPTPTAGTSVTLNDTAPSGDTWNLAAVEILPASS